MSKQYEMYLTLEKNKIAQAKQVILANLEYVGIEELLEDLGIDYSAYQLCALSKEENAALEQKLAGYLENVFFEEKASSLKAVMNPGLYDPDSFDYTGSRVCEELFRLWPDSRFEFSGTADLFSIHWFVLDTLSLTFENGKRGTSLVVQWLRLHASLQGVQV